MSLGEVMGQVLQNESSAFTVSRGDCMEGGHIQTKKRLTGSSPSYQNLQRFYANLKLLCLGKVSNKLQTLQEFSKHLHVSECS